MVAEDEKEQGVRAHLNFGHTFAHAIEASPVAQARAAEKPRRRVAPPPRFETPKPPPEAHAYEGLYAPGEAVSLGMVAATSLAVAQGRCDNSLLERLVALLDRIGLPTSSDQLADTDLLMGIMQSDKKVKDGRVRLVLPDRLGAVSVVGDTASAILGRLRIDTRMTLEGEMTFVEETDDLRVDHMIDGRWRGVIRTSEDEGPPFEGWFEGSRDAD